MIYVCDDEEKFIMELARKGLRSLKAKNKKCSKVYVDREALKINTSPENIERVQEAVKKVTAHLLSSK